MRAAAKKAGYDPKTIDFATDGKKKFVITTPEGRKVKFGGLGLHDFYLYKHDKPKEADERRRLFLGRTKYAKGDWRTNKFAPNALSRRILWASGE